MKGEVARRRNGCSYCLYDIIMTDEQKFVSNSNNKIPTPHVTREVVEQLCSHNVEEVCVMKYLVERIPTTNREMVQNACVLFHTGEKYGWDNVKVRFMDGYRDWSEERLFGNMIKGSYAGRFKEVWNVGNVGGRHMWAAFGIYNAVKTNDFDLYRRMVDGLADLKSGYFKRNGWKPNGKILD